MRQVGLLTFLFFIVATNYCFSQISYGLKAGLNISEIKIQSAYDTSPEQVSPLASYHVSTFLEIPLSSSISLQPNLSLQNKGYKLIYDLDKIAFDVGFGPADPSYIMKYTSIDVPINLLYNKAISNSGTGYIGLGPYVGFNLTGKTELIHYDGNVYRKTFDVEIGDNKDLKLMDYGVNGLLGYKFNTGLLFNAGYSLGLANIYGHHQVGGSAPTWKNRVISFGIGYQF